MIDICDALRDLVPYVQFKKREKQPWRSVFHVYWCPSTTQSPSSKNYSICSYEPLPLSSMKRCCSICLFTFLRIICLLCFTECLIKDEVFTKFLSLTINIVWKDCFVVTFFKVISCILRCECQIWAQNSNN